MSFHVALWGTLENDTSPRQTSLTKIWLDKQVSLCKLGEEVPFSFLANSVSSHSVDLASEAQECPVSLQGAVCTTVHGIVGSRQWQYIVGSGSI